MKIYFNEVWLGLAAVLLASCTSQPGFPPSFPPPSPEVPSASRVDLPHKSLPSERIKGYGYGRQTGKVLLSK
ncbi:MAG: hypothetical protein K0M45_02170 [Candidatus Paracaedibacteraceae bacterium]|nr:hypothetical protein [Candidatus Paracaedibacteraceae bacterium]